MVDGVRDAGSKLGNHFSQAVSFIHDDFDVDLEFMVRDRERMIKALSGTIDH